MKLLCVLCTRLPVPVGDARWRIVPRRCPGNPDILLLIEQVLEIGPGGLEAGCLRVRQIVGDHVELRLHGVHARGGRVKCLDAHGFVGWVGVANRGREFQPDLLHQALRILSDEV